MHPRILFLSLAVALLALPLAAQEDAPAGDPKNQPKNQPAKAATDKPLDVGAEVPADFALPGLDGKPVRFGDLRGKTVVLHFWSLTCPSEKAAEPKLAALTKAYEKKDVVVLAINANANEIGAAPKPEQFETKDASERPYASVHAHVEKTKFNHPVLFDHSGEAIKLFQARTTPHCFVIDKQGVLRYSGALDNDPRGNGGDEVKPYVQLAVDAVLAGKDVETQTTKPYG
jgi:peroxiredoxin